jgi:CheY-like chemotaxis protein
MASVLLVDDHPDLREVVGQLLQIEGHEVRYSPSAEDALAELSRHPPDAVIVDHRLPGMSGLQLLARLRGGESTRHLPIIVYSADDTQRESARAAGADDFWLKGSEGLFEGVSRLADRLSVLAAGGGVKSGPPGGSNEGTGTKDLSPDPAGDPPRAAQR